MPRLFYGVKLGMRWCVDANREGADIWREIWAMLSEMKDVRVGNVKTHLKYQDVAEGRISFELWVGNGVADLWAKTGCEVACEAAPGYWPRMCWKRAQAWDTWVTKVATD